ncbi:MAG TPA: cell wall hydrolase [Bosea sp. (in: a-proteobacteria)]|uniref:cell wall hydrolase n=1 Tax=Bosea sp. (in: a-proteobacteria) TaxID=1871050 RepID=UPI002E139662|nr:cell wall hydrolase [Bosea sp. (in: a-proteobacteria)]
MSHLRLRRRTRRIGSLGLKWALATTAPWALSVGMLVSFTASAGQNFSIDTLPTTSLSRTLPGPDSELEEGPSMLIAASAFRLPGLSLSSAVRQAHLSFDDPERRVAIDPRQPREEMKRSVAGFPEVDRTAKGDALPRLRPSISAKAPRELERVVFGDNQPGLISGGFSLDALREAEALTGPQIGFEPYAEDQGLTDPALSDASPDALKSANPYGAVPRTIDGATPGVTSEIARGSSTPAVSYSVTTLVPALALPLAPERPGLLARGPASSERRGGRAEPGPREIYTGLIAAGDMARQQRCLAEAVYFEARSESEEGRAAVAQVVLNRVKSGLYPDTVCGVVYQNSNRYLACQFTFTCEGKSLRITEPEPWRAAVRIAREVYEGTTYMPEVGASTHYHAQYVRPYWAKKLKKMDTIGQHVFYKLRPGQT